MLPEVYTNYVETGRVEFVFLDFPFDERSPAFKAAEASHCAGDQDRFWEMHHQLFANPEALSADDLVEHAATLELDVDAFQACIKKRPHASGIREDVRLGRQLGIKGTPAYVLGLRDEKKGKIRVVDIIGGNVPFDQLAAKIEEHLPAE